jgi:hypothetical protein
VITGKISERAAPQNCRDVSFNRISTANRLQQHLQRRGRTRSASVLPRWEKYQVRRDGSSSNRGNVHEAPDLTHTLPGVPKGGR